MRVTANEKSVETNMLLHRLANGIAACKGPKQKAIYDIDSLSVTTVDMVSQFAATVQNLDGCLMQRLICAVVRGHTNESRSPKWLTVIRHKLSTCQGNHAELGCPLH